MAGVDLLPAVDAEEAGADSVATAWTRAPLIPSSVRPPSPRGYILPDSITTLPTLPPATRATSRRGAIGAGELARGPCAAPPDPGSNALQETSCAAARLWVLPDPGQRLCSAQHAVSTAGAGELCGGAAGLLAAPTRGWVAAALACGPHCVVNPHAPQEAAYTPGCLCMEWRTLHAIRAMQIAEGIPGAQ